jgi:glycerophosphoryl diester phosphodiesterase
MAASCVAIAGQQLDPANIYDQRHQCGTCEGQASKPTLCRAINRAMVPYWSANSDLVAIPHRGIWGQPLNKGAAENTLGALKTSLAKGYHIVEIDVALTGPNNLGKREVFLGHYFTMTAVGGPANKQPSDYTPQDIVKFKMRKRDQTRSTDPEDRLIMFTDALAWAAQNQVLLMVDPKIPENPETHEYEKIVAYVLNEARATGALANIGIKNTGSYASTMKNMTPFLNAPVAAYEGQFLWSPIINKSVGVTKDAALSKIKAWHAATSDSKQILTYELSLFSQNHWTANSFTDGAQYQNGIDYLRQLTPLGKRTAIWSIDPMGDKGTFGRMYNWKFVGNMADDGRGNPFKNMSYFLATHLVVNTDRPDWYEGMVSSPY